MSVSERGHRHNQVLRMDAPCLEEVVDFLPVIGDSVARLVNLF